MWCQKLVSLSLPSAIMSVPPHAILGDTTCHNSHGFRRCAWRTIEEVLRVVKDYFVGNVRFVYRSRQQNDLLFRDDFTLIELLYGVADPVNLLRLSAAMAPCTLNPEIPREPTIAAAFARSNSTSCFRYTPLPCRSVMHKH